MQLTYNNQSLLATGCYEADDNGVTRMGRQVIKEMNRVGMVVDMSHSAKDPHWTQLIFPNGPSQSPMPTLRPGIRQNATNLTMSCAPFLHLAACLAFRYTRTISGQIYLLS